MADTELKTYYDKPAPADYSIHELIQKRWSARSFDSRPIEPQKLLSIFEAARWAASSHNSQPWRFIMARNDMTQSFADLLSVLKEGNQLWAKHAPVLGIAVAQVEDEQGRQLTHGEHDTGMAVAHIALQAAAEDIHMRMMAGFYPNQARDLYNIPANFKPLTAFALGYYGTPDDLPEEKRLHDKERPRRPIAETVFAGSWEQPARLVREER